MRGHPLNSSTMTGLGTPGAVARLVAGVVGQLLDVVADAAVSRSRRRRLRTSTRDPERLRQVLAERGYAASTCSKYQRIVTNFLCEVAGTPTHEDVVAYLQGLFVAGRSNGTIRTRLCAIRAVCDKVLGLGITDGVRHRPAPAPRPAATQAEVIRLLRVAGSDKDRHTIKSFFHLDLMPHRTRLLARCEEVALEPGEPALRVTLRLQGGPQTWIYTVQAEDGPRPDWLFQSPCRAAPLSTRTLRRRVRALAISCGLKTTCTAIRKAGRSRALSAV